MSPLNDGAEENMPIKSVTLDTSHLEISPLNDLAYENNLLILVTAETSQDPIGPCGPLEQSVDSSRHCTIAALSSQLDFGAHAVVPACAMIQVSDHDCWGNTSVDGLAG